MKSGAMVNVKILLLWQFTYVEKTGGVVKVDIYEVDTKIELYVDTFLLGL